MKNAIRAERKGDVYAITLNRPEAGNALSDPMIVHLGDLLEAVDTTVRVITIEGAGADFCVGREPPPPGAPRKAMEALELRRAHDIVFRAYGLVRKSPVPVVALVRGRALGFGFALAALGGVVAAPITTVEFRTGVDILPFCFMAVIIGGLGNLPGTAAAAVLLASLEGIIQSFADPTVARISSLVLMSAVLLVRPQGLFKGLAK
jgi:enoyl-CoA hydratase/carnithine racemase